MVGRRDETGCATDEFEAVLVTGAGIERRVWRRSLPEMVGEIAGPVRSFPSYGEALQPGSPISLRPRHSVRVQVAVFGVGLRKVLLSSDVVCGF